MSSQLENIDFIKYLLDQPIMKGLTESELIEIVPYIEVLAFKPGTTIFYEGEQSNDLCIIYEGEVLLIKNSEDKQQEYLLMKLSKGEVVGEMAFLANTPRSCNVKSESELVLIKLLHKGYDEGTIRVRYIYGKISRNLATILISRLIKSNSLIEKNRRTEAQKAQIQKNLMRFFLHFITALMLASGLLVFYYSNASEPYFPLARWLAVLFMLIPVYEHSRRYHKPLNKFGLSSDVWTSLSGKEWAWSGFIIAIFLLFLIGGKLLGIRMNPLLDSLSIINLPIYFAYAFICEFLFRGVLQTSINNLITPQPGWMGVLFAAAIVASCNLPFGLTTALLVFGLNLSCGFLYLSQQNLLTATILHLSLFLILNSVKYFPYSIFV